MEEVTTMGQLERVRQSLGPRLRIARENADMSQAQLAAHLGVAEASVAAWEADERAPRANRLVMMAGILGVSINWLLEGREDKYMEHGVAWAIDSLRSELERLRALLSEAQSTLGAIDDHLAAVERHGGE